MNVVCHSGVNKASAHPALWEALCLGSPTNVRRINISSILSDGFHSSDRMQYPGSLLRDLILCS